MISNIGLYVYGDIPHEYRETIDKIPEFVGKIDICFVVPAESDSKFYEYVKGGSNFANPNLTWHKLSNFAAVAPLNSYVYLAILNK